MKLVYVFVPVVSSLIGVAFFTLLERKVLGYVMNRKGPNKVGYMGVMQPFSDAGKLFLKELVVPSLSNKVLFCLCPGLMLLLALLFWILYPIESGELRFFSSVLCFLGISGVSVYSTMASGWASNSKYASLGCMRSVAQSISYEVSMALVVLVLVLIYGSLGFVIMHMWQGEFMSVLSMGECFSVITVAWLFSMLAETNRAPFDFVEGESELVSGFNVEYSSGAFAFIFIAEYSNMLFMSLLSCVLLCGGCSLSLALQAMFLVFFFVWIRGSVPRLRYDVLMYLAWKLLLSTCLSFLLVFFLVLSLFTLFN